MFAKTDSLTLTADIWTDSKNMQSFFKAIVTDGGSNIRAAVRDEFGSDKHISCAAHLLNSVGQAVLRGKVTPVPSEASSSEVVEVPEDEDEAAALQEVDEEGSTPAVNDSGTPTEVWPLIMTVKRTVRFFRTSGVASAELKEVQIRNGRNPGQTLKLVQEVPTVEFDILHVGQIFEASRRCSSRSVKTAARTWVYETQAAGHNYRTANQYPYRNSRPAQTSCRGNANALQRKIGHSELRNPDYFRS